MTAFVPLGEQVCLLKMLGSNCIFIDVKGQTLLSSPAEVKLIFFFDVTVPSVSLHPPPSPPPVTSAAVSPGERQSFIHLAASPRSLCLFCSPLYCRLAPSSLHYTPPLSLTRRFHRSNISSFNCASCPSPGLLGRNVGLFFSLLSLILNRANSSFCLTRRVLRSQSAGVQYQPSARQQIHSSVTLKIVSPLHSRGHFVMAKCFTNSLQTISYLLSSLFSLPLCCQT